MRKRKGSVVNSHEHLTQEKGDNARKARPGNTNTANGPRLGRRGKETTLLPQPRSDAKLPQRRRRAKTGGRDFVKGHNSHDGTVFQRTKDQLPRGNGTLMLRIVFHDIRDKLYARLMESGDTHARASAFMKEYIDRTEGTPVRHVERTTQRETTFLLTTKDGIVPALPEKVGGATPAAPECRGPAHPRAEAGADMKKPRRVIPSRPPGWLGA